MEDYPRNLIELEKRFDTEEACLEYLIQIRWPEGFQCPKCRYKKAWFTKRSLFHCEQCGFQTSPIVGTLFQDTKKPLSLWFRAMWHVTSQKYGANALGLQRILGLGSYHTAWRWLHKLRRAMVRPGRDRLSGRIEVDEAYIGGKKPGKRGRGAEGKALVVVMVDISGDKIGRIRLKRVKDASAQSLQGAIKESVEPGSEVCTDDWRGYGDLPAIGYTRTVIRDDSVVGENLLPSVNRVVALLKRWLLGTYQGGINLSHLDYYLDEYTFRFNRRTSRSRGKLFYRLVQQAIAIEPILVKDIYGGSKNTGNVG